jgi:mRNA interferase ChpB
VTPRHIPQRGDIYWIDPSPIVDRETKGRHRFVIISPQEINSLRVSIVVPVASGGVFAKASGLNVPIIGHETTGVAVCNQVKSFDIEARERVHTARYIETLDAATIDEIVLRVASIIDPLPEN